MKIRYRRALSITALISGAVITGLVALIESPRFSFRMLNGVPFLLIAIALRFRSVGELTDKELILRALYGGTERYFPIAHLRVVDGRLFYRDRRVPIAAWTVDARDWRALMQRLQTDRTAPP